MATSVDCVCLTGPTACGKTELALRLAEHVPLEVVSMDSALVYRGMDIGTAKPSLAVRQQVPHHLIDIIDASEAYSAGRFVRDAEAKVEEIKARGRLPLLVGGTHLYLRAIRDGIADLPEADSTVRNQLDAEAEMLGWPALHERLASIDPDAAERISPSDGQRIQRALEVFELTGKSLTDQQRASHATATLTVKTFAVLPTDRGALAERIEQRFDSMVAEGFVEEVEKFKAREDLSPTTPAMRAVGYRQMWAYLAGECSWAEARDRALAATRQLAKRQLTSLRSDALAETLALEGQDVERTFAVAVQAVVTSNGHELSN
ncbi:MAG: tRNA (adenosine(37)-N6)-dimethylallyltransferase MiaA [Candidatus Rariloculaceae bacterium]